ncbi:MAG: (2Fe-2S)-binding protein [Xanthobacteraceae bacterium]
MSGLLRRIAEDQRQTLRITVDGTEVAVLENDTLLTAILTVGTRLRQGEFGDGDRAGFCLMGACQDCWVWTEAGDRLRACSTTVMPEMRIVTGAVPWP